MGKTLFQSNSLSLWPFGTGQCETVWWFYTSPILNIMAHCSSKQSLKSFIGYLYWTLVFYLNWTHPSLLQTTCPMKDHRESHRPVHQRAYTNRHTHIHSHLLAFLALQFTCISLYCGANWSSQKKLMPTQIEHANPHRKASLLSQESQAVWRQ